MVNNSNIIPLKSDVALDELTESAVVIGVPLTTPLRNTTLLEVMLIKGPVGCAEFLPFHEYGPQESARWLSTTIEAGWHGWPDPVRDVVPVNATVPAVAPDDVEMVLAKFGPVPAVKVKVAEDDLAVAIARVQRGGELLLAADIRSDANAKYTHDEAFEVITDRKSVV